MFGLANGEVGRQRGGKFLLGQPAGLDILLEIICAEHDGDAALVVHILLRLPRLVSPPGDYVVIMLSHSLHRHHQQLIDLTLI